MIIGHRGSPEDAVENTASSFISAVNAGSDILETDVRISYDGFIVVSHDADFSRLGGPAKPINKSTKEEIEKIILTDQMGRSERPLFMDRALKMFPDVRFSVDLKDSGYRMVKAWSDLLVSHHAVHRCRTASFSDRTLRLFRNINPDAPVSVARLSAAALLLSTLLRIPRPPESSEGVLQLPEFFGPLRILSPGTIKRWKQKGWEVQVWTVDEEEDMRRFIRWGIDGIITNRPHLLKKVLDSTDIY